MSPDRSQRPLALIALLALAACSGGPEEVTPATIPDPTTLERSGAPHDALVCPHGACAAGADRAAPVYAVPPEALLAAWRETVAAEPRAAVVAEDPGRLLLAATQRSLVFRFVDAVTVRVLPAEGGGSTFAAYSTSRVGYYDFGVNAARLRRWEADLGRRVSPAPAAAGSGTPPPAAPRP